MTTSLDFIHCSNDVAANGSSHVDFNISVSDHLVISNSFVIDSVLFKKDEMRRKWEFKCDWKKIYTVINKVELDTILDKIKIPFQLLKQSSELTESEKKIAINIYSSKIKLALRCAERCAVPVRKVSPGSEILGLSINPTLQESCKSLKFWHQILNDCDPPKSGAV